MDNSSNSSYIKREESRFRFFVWLKNLFFSQNKNEGLSELNPNTLVKENNNCIIIDGVNTNSESSKKMAAYALNLCTVSVSQIVDYDDIHILEQEYEAILNNLNLENIPKDEALLLVLKQILDTITFFRIQEGDKKMLQKSYEQKVKNAIWNAVPNFGMIVGGSPITMAISLASMVGMGYMNYRREKARINLENEQQQWQLQRSAIEQFNALRRELFDTAWRLADRYKFKDNYRLTEKQISLYDEILMDPNPLRRYQRLDNVKSYFEAYPPFWYYLGSTANSVYHDYKGKNDKISNVFKENAIEAFEYYIKVNNLDLLRIDQIRTSCDLEYADILCELDKKENHEKILNLVNDAYNHSGRATDVLQGCSIKYIQIEEYDRAQEVLMELIVEDSNASMNAFLLSGLYIKQVRRNQSKYADYEKKYNVLMEFVNCASLLPWPSLKELEIYDNTPIMTQKQKNVIKSCEGILDWMCGKYELLFKKAVLYIPEFDQYQNNIYANDYSSERREKFLDYVTKHLLQYRQELQKMPLRGRVCKVTQDLLDELEDLSRTMLDVEGSIGEELAQGVSDIFYNKINKIDEDLTGEIDKLINNGDYNDTFPVELYEKINKIDFLNIFLLSCFAQYLSIIDEEIKKCEEITQLAKIEEDLNNYCICRGIELNPKPKQILSSKTSYPILEAGFKMEDHRRLSQIDKKIKDVIRRFTFKIRDNSVVVKGLDDNEGLQINNDVLKMAQKKPILVSVEGGSRIIYFTREGIIAKEKGLFSDWKLCQFKDFQIDDGAVFVDNRKLVIPIDLHLLEEMCKQCKQFLIELS